MEASSARMGGVSERLFPARANADLVRRENERPGTRDWVLTSAMNPAVERGRSEKSVGVFGGVMTSAARLPVSVGHGDVRSPRSRPGLSRPEAAGGLRAHGDGAPKVILIIAGTRPRVHRASSRFPRNGSDGTLPATRGSISRHPDLRSTTEAQVLMRCCQMR